MALYEQPLTTTCRFIDRPWGGVRIHQLLNKQTAHSSLLGESWEVSDLPDCRTQVGFAHYQCPVGEFFRSYPEALGSMSFDAFDHFPILLKYIDASETLSVQLHPGPEDIGNLPNDPAPKNEAWYIIKAAPGAAIYLGLKDVHDEDELTSLIAHHQLQNHLNKINVRPGELYYVPSGTVHAIGAGVLLAEVQQCSDTTYRIYDWGRLGLDGNPRQLHIAESLKCISLKPADLTSHYALHTPDFNIDIVNNRKVVLPAGELYMLMVVNGAISVQDLLGDNNYCYAIGSTFILPASRLNWFLDTSNGTALVVTAGGLKIL